ncbi:E3 ubiquitin-protein ligase XIAP-like isoform X2 [Dysidea avara]
MILTPIQESGHMNEEMVPHLLVTLPQHSTLKLKDSVIVHNPSSNSRLKYDQLEDRLKTFALPPSWEGPLDAHSMSEAGFVYTGQEDLVYCFNCNIKLDGWTKHMDPLLRHKEESPTCSFVRQQLQVIKGEKGKVKSVVAPPKPLNPRQTASIGQLQSSTVFSSKPIHTVVTGLDEPRLSYATSRGSELGDDYSKMYLPITVENYRLEEERLKSYVGWPLNESVHPEQLARVGFVYTGEGSLVQCFQCGVRCRNWLKGDIPLSVHQRCNPRCAFLHTLASKTKAVEEQRPSFSFIQPESMLPTTQNEDIALLQFPDYSDQATRLQSFKYWGGVLPKEELAEAGFYMIARRDVVKCFSCHVVLQDWEKSDNVINEHQRHNPNCTFLKLSHKEGSVFALKRTTHSFGDTSSAQLSIEKKRGVTPNLRVEAEKGTFATNHTRGTIQLSDNSSDCDGDDKRLTDIIGRRFDPSNMWKPSEDDVRNIDVEEYELSTLSARILCWICSERKISCIFLPCGHARTCVECATRIKNSGQRCPYCKTPVSMTHHIIL